MTADDPVASASPEGDASSAQAAPDYEAMWKSALDALTACEEGHGIRRIDGRAFVHPGEGGWHEDGDGCEGYERHYHQKARRRIVYVETRVSAQAAPATEIGRAHAQVLHDAGGDFDLPWVERDVIAIEQAAVTAALEGLRAEVMAQPFLRENVKGDPMVLRVSVLALIDARLGR